MSDQPSLSHWPLSILAALILSACTWGSTEDSAASGSGSGSTNSTNPGTTAPPTASDTTGAAGVLPASSVGLVNSGCYYSYERPVLRTGTGVDPLLTQQWYLHNDGRVGQLNYDLNVLDAWQVTQGRGTRVAVIDDALEVTHDDLVGNVDFSANYDYRNQSRGGPWPLPCLDYEIHGTQVGGIIAARYFNGVGGSGVAPAASLAGLNALATNADADIADALNRGMNVTGVYNNSWGSDDDGRLHPAETSFRTAIDNGLRNGRNGKGVSYVFSSGNGGCYRKGTDNTCTTDIDNANYDGYVNGLGVIATCAVGADGLRPFYGEHGANLLSCAMSSSDIAGGGVTTTRVENGYTPDFTGTSASAPMMSGVVALMQSVNPNLTWRDVILIIAQASRQNDPAHPDWSLSPASGLTFNHQYGFGVVDARRAVDLASSWTSVGGSSTLQKCTFTSTQNNVAIPDGAGAARPALSALQAGTCGIRKIEFVQAEVQITEASLAATGPHPNYGDLAIALVSPSGTESRLSEPHDCYSGFGSSPINCANGLTRWTFGSVRHMNEPALGTWTLRVADTRTNQQAGQIKNWTLTLYGH